MVVVVKTPEQPDYGSEIKSGDKLVEPAPNARQGVTGHNVRTVLLVSVVGLILLYAIVYLLFFTG
ncbi:MAG: hypothetical protein J0H94_15655 [Rhizobiales bacterium]|nr:hypothetical protein [Hyphomicrobiales bacterium]